MKTETRNQILENAPEGALYQGTHCIEFGHAEGYSEGVQLEDFIDIHNLSDLRELQEKDQELIKMKARIDELETIIVANQIADETGYISDFGWVNNWNEMEAEVLKLLESFKLTQQAKGVVMAYRLELAEDCTWDYAAQHIESLASDLLNQAKEL